MQVTKGAPGHSKSFALFVPGQQFVVVNPEGSTVARTRVWIEIHLQSFS